MRHRPALAGKVRNRELEIERLASRLAPTLLYEAETIKYIKNRGVSLHCIAFGSCPVPKHDDKPGGKD